MTENPPNDSAETGRLLAESVAAFVASHPGPARIRALRGTRPGVDRAIWREAAEAGWLGLRLPETVGGAALGVAELAVLTEGLGRGLAPEPVVATVVLAGGVLARAPASPRRDALLAAMAAGELVPALAWQETANDCDPARLETVAVDARLSGRKCFVVAAGAADGFVVTARSAVGPALFWLAADAPGLRLVLDETVDGGWSGTLDLDNAAAEPIAAGPDVVAWLEEALEEARLAAAAELLGVMSAALDITLDYVRQRRQFDAPIGSFQALQHRLVDMWIQRELCQASLRRAVATFDAGGRERALTVSAVKARCSDAGLLIGRQGIQLHGGMGYTDACDIGLCLKRAVVLAAFLGNATQQRRRFAALSAEAA
jgi:alkylation response protein AidB-like acyl-CoA dehydrogenase